MTEELNIHPEPVIIKEAMRDGHVGVDVRAFATHDRIIWINNRTPKGELIYPYEYLFTRAYARTCSIRDVPNSTIKVYVSLINDLTRMRDGQNRLTKRERG